MTNSSEPPPVDVIVRRIEHGDPTELGGTVSAYYNVETEMRKELLQRLRSLAEEDARCVSPLSEAVVPFLTDEERSVRLTTAKYFVTLARQAPDAVVDEAQAIANRVSDEEEFYYVRARSAEALGYVAVEFPEEIATPELLADLRIGLAFDEPEVKEKLAKALAYVALGNPDRLRHQIDDLADHLDDENELVRYHLATAIVAVGCVHPKSVAEGREALLSRFEDECVYVRGRAVEAIGLLARERDSIEMSIDRLTSLVDRLDTDDDGVSFLYQRVQFAVAGVDNSTNVEVDDSIGSLEAIRDETDTIVESIRSPDGDECPHCGLELPDTAPPMCPRCGAPY